MGSIPATSKGERVVLKFARCQQNSEIGRRKMSPAFTGENKQSLGGKSVQKPRVPRFDSRKTVWVWTFKKITLLCAFGSTPSLQSQLISQNQLFRL